MSTMGQVDEMPDDFGLEISNRLVLGAIDRYPAGARDLQPDLVRSFESIEHSLGFDVAEGGRTDAGRIEFESEIEMELSDEMMPDAMQVSLEFEGETTLELTVE